MFSVVHGRGCDFNQTTKERKRIRPRNALPLYSHNNVSSLVSLLAPLPSASAFINLFHPFLLVHVYRRIWFPRTFSAYSRRFRSVYPLTPAGMYLFFSLRPFRGHKRRWSATIRAIRRTEEPDSRLCRGVHAGPRQENRGRPCGLGNRRGGWGKSRDEQI